MNVSVGLKEWGGGGGIVTAREVKWS